MLVAGGDLVTGCGFCAWGFCQRLARRGDWSCPVKEVGCHSLPPYVSLELSPYHIAMNKAYHD